MLGHWLIWDDLSSDGLSLFYCGLPFSSWLGHLVHRACGVPREGVGAHKAFGGWAQNLYTVVLKLYFVKFNHRPKRDSRDKKIDWLYLQSHIVRDVEQLGRFLQLSYYNRKMLSLNAKWECAESRNHLDPGTCSLFATPVSINSP